MTRYAPYVGFGDPDDYENFAHFRVEIQGQEDVYPDWQPVMLESTRQIAGTSSFETQVMGFGPARITLFVVFDCRADYRRFLAKVGTVATLSLLAGFTSHEGPIRTHLGRDYEQFRDTLLLAPANVQNRVGGAVECLATFQRANAGMGVPQ